MILSYVKNKHYPFKFMYRKNLSSLTSIINGYLAIDSSGYVNEFSLQCD